ncbi:MAG TPA: DNA cytosine methyltransferase, partial [Streptosporangiaceae bacterium]|nr:DNA cytosine methyltransferase [Streptosporangiaceae bacterium]
TSLTAGSASPGVSIPGGHQEDDVNLVAAPQCVTGSVTHALTSEGADASEDGTGRGSPLGTVTSGEPRPVPSCAVRRLTPLERERLQGFEDEWTRWRLEDGELIEQSDSARDRQTGNAVAIPVVEWIARRLVAADAEARGEKSGAA